MTIQTQRRSLLGLTAIFAFGTVGVIYWSMAKLESSAIFSSFAGDGPPSLANPTPKKTKAIDLSLASRSLRGPMADQKPDTEPQPSEVAPAIPAPSVVKSPADLGPKFKLVGTVIDSESPVAIISDSKGKSDAKGIGDQLDLTPAGVTIESIKREQVTLRYQGKPLIVSLNKSPVANRPTRGIGPTTTRRPVNGRGR